MTAVNPILALDQWLRGDFLRINTALDELYFEDGVDVIHGRADVDALKLELLRGGAPLVRALSDAPLPAHEDDSYRLLGLVGYYLAACQRHEAFAVAENEGGRGAAWKISERIGSALSVAPRFVFAHQSLFNDATAGRFRTFTSLPDDEVFVRYNILGVLAYERAAHALRCVADVGVTNSAAGYLFDAAEAALIDVLRFNQELSRQLNVERFFLNVRPYYKTYRVGDRDFRGANAGDFSAINEIDVALGLCRLDDPFYRGIVREKIDYVPPADRRRLDALDRSRSFLDLFLHELDANGATPAWKDNAPRYLRVCKAHGAAYAHHHNRLVKSYVEAPSQALATVHSAGLTSSGPPLNDLMTMLQRLADLRLARDRGDIVTAAPGLARIQAQLAG